MDVDSLWDFQNPELSEQKFKAALNEATGDQPLIIQTQIARTFSMRQDYETARKVLSTLEPELRAASAEARARYSLELGRTYVSAAHGKESLSTGTLDQARSLYLEAYETAKAANLDGLAVDALHMMAFVDTEPQQQLQWAQKALAVVNSSEQLAAKKWEPSLLNNMGYALYRLGRYAEALVEFENAVVLREAGDNPWATHVSHWMVAWTLRALGRVNQALEIQLRLERERDEVGDPDSSVFEELASLYKTMGNVERANHYAAKVKALVDPS